MKTARLLVLVEPQMYAAVVAAAERSRPPEVPPGIGQIASWVREAIEEKLRREEGGNDAINP